MSPEDQQAIRELVNEFGLQRDAAKNERDKVIIGFQSQALPMFRGMVEDILRKIPKLIEPAPSETKVGDTPVTSNGVVGDSKIEPHQQQAVPAPLPLAKEVIPPPLPPASEAIPPPSPASEDLPVDQASTTNPAASLNIGIDVDEPMPDQAKSADAPTEKIPVSAQVPSTEAENREAGAAEQSAQISEEPTAMEVDDDKELKVKVPVPATDAAGAEPPNAESAATASAAHPKTGQAAVDVPLHPDEILPENRGERRKLVGQRLRKLETGFQTVTSTTEELTRRFGKLEEQVLYQEEQLNEYLDTRSLEMEAKSRLGRKRISAKQLVSGSETGQTPVPGAPSTPVPAEPVSAGTQSYIPPNLAAQPSIPPPVVIQPPIPPSAVTQPAIPSSVVDMANIETIRAEAMRSLDEQLQQLAQDQERRLAEMAQAQEARVTALGIEIRIEIQSEATRAEQAYASAIEAADDKAVKLETQLTALQTELTQFKQERKIIEDIIKQQSAADQLIKTMRETMRESSLKTQVHEQAFRNNNNTRLGEIDDRLTAHNDRLTEYNTRLNKHDDRLVEHTKHLAEHDSQLLAMSTFEETKEAWRGDMIDMKNHVIGRVDYLEEQVESIKKPLVARLNAQTGEQALASTVQRTSSPVARTSSPAAQPSQPTRTPAAQALGAPSHRPIMPQPAQAIPLPPPASQPVQPQQGRAALAPQAARASPADTSNRLTLNRGGTSGTALNSTVSSGHPTAQGQPQSQPRLGFAGHAHGTFEQQFGNGNMSPFSAAPPMHNPLMSQAWRGPSNSPVAMQQPVVQPRASTFGNEPDQTMRTSLSGNPVARPASNGPGVPAASTAADSALSARLNGGQYQRAEASPQPLLPLRMRMHSGAGVATGNWGQPGSPSTQQGMTNPGSEQVSPATSEGALGGRLGARMFDPGEAKPPPL